MHERYLRGLQVTFDVPGPLPPLPAAIETAAYWITAEALTNVVRHAAATCVVVGVVVDVALVVSIVDDGVGVPERRTPGVGLASGNSR